MALPGRALSRGLLWSAALLCCAAFVSPAPCASKKQERRSKAPPHSKAPHAGGGLAAAGCAVLFVSHRLGEVLDFGVKPGHGLAYAQRSFGVLAAFDE